MKNVLIGSLLVLGLAFASSVSGTKIDRSQVGPMTPITNVVESHVSIPDAPASLPLSIITGAVGGCKYMEVFQNHLAISNGYDYSMSLDCGTVTVNSVAQGDEFKFVVFQ